MTDQHFELTPDMALEPELSAIASLPVGPDARPPGLGRSLALIGLALVTFLAAAAAQRLVLPYPPDYELGPKLEHLAADPDAYDLAYLGSSAVFRHFVPEVFDAKLAEAGYPLRSLNLGAPALAGFELDHALSELASIDGLELDFLLLEPSSYTLELLGSGTPTARQVHYHDTRTMLRFLGVLRRDDGLPWGQRLVALGDRLQCYAWHLANYGQGPRLLDGVRGLRPMDAEADWIVEAGGYQPLEASDDPDVLRRRRKLQENVGPYMEEAKALERAHMAGPDLATLDVSFYLDQVELVRALGALPVHVISATLAVQRPIWALAELPGFPPTLAYNRPTAYSDLYLPKARFDRNHLNQEHALLLTELLAADFLEASREQLEAWRVGRTPR